MNEWSGTHAFILKGDYTVLVQDVNTRKPVIVQVTEGDGTVVLSLVHLFINDEEIFHNEGFTISDVNKLNQSKSARIWMLSHVLQILGISCKPGHLPELTPMYLMARKMVSWHTIYFQFLVLSITKVYYVFNKIIICMQVTISLIFTFI